MQMSFSNLHTPYVKTIMENVLVLGSFMDQIELWRFGSGEGSVSAAD